MTSCILSPETCLKIIVKLAPELRAALPATVAIGEVKALHYR